MKKEVSNKIKILNFMFTLLIVVYHYIDINKYKIIYTSELSKKITKILFWYFDHFGFLAMSFFFMMSAFLFYFNINTSKQAFEKFKKRIKTLLIPYFTWNIIVIIYVIVISGRLPFYSIKDIIRILFLAPINGPLWYCLALLILMAFSPIIIKFKKNKKTIILLFVMSISFFLLKNFGYLAPFLNIESWWWKSNIVCYIPAFATGMLLGMLEPNYILHEKYNKEIMRVISFALLIVSIILMQYEIFYDFRYIIYVLEVISIWFIVSGPIKINATFYKVIGCSFFVYALHQPILIPIVNKITNYFFGVGLVYWQYLIIKLCQIGLIVMISYFVYYILKKILPEKIMFIFNGGRG